jgi:hypothetical protein
MESQDVWRDEPVRQLSRVQRDVRFRIQRTQVVDHPHVQREVADGNGRVFRLHEVEADDSGFGRGDFEARENLGEDFFRRRRARDLRRNER